MFSWRLKIREARTALNNGRPEEASKILQHESVRDFLPAKRLSHEVAKHLVDRAQRRFEGGDSIASWTDLQQAAHLGGCDQQVAQLRQAQTSRGLQHIHRLLLRGETQLAAQQITKLEQRHLGGSERRAWKLIIHLISKARELSDQGKSSEAVDMLERALGLLPNPQDELGEMLAHRKEKIQQHQQQLRDLSTQLHEQLTSEAWTEVLSTADAMLELAPQHSAAKQARGRAWDAVGMKVTQAHRPCRVQQLAKSLASTHAWATSAKVDTKAMKREAGKRLVTWIDGIGGYMICLGDEVMLGQPAGGGGADIPILADLSRRHATIRREGEAYVLSPIHRVSIDSVELQGPQVLKDDALIQLGDTVRLRFRKPHALSGTAVLTLESHHKTDPAVDGIVLMSESCVLGSQPQSHIPCRGWTEDLVLFRRDDGLQFRTAATVEVDGEPASGNPTGGGGVISDRTCINGDTFSLSFEEV